MQLGDYIKERRTRLGITQQILADHLNVSKQAVSKWENGTALPDITIIPRLAQALRVRPTKIVAIIWEGESDFQTYRFTCNHKPSFIKERVDVLLRADGLYEVRCTEEKYDHILEKYGEKEQIKTVYPQRKLMDIIRNNKPTRALYSDEDCFRLIADEQTSLLCGIIYHSYPYPNDHSGRRLARLLGGLIKTIYLETLTLDVFLSAINNSDSVWEFDRGYGELCKYLLKKEEEIRTQPYFAEVISFDKSLLYLSPHMVIQAIFTDLIACGIIPIDHPNIRLLHYSVFAGRVGGDYNKRDMGDYDGYLDFQNAALRYADSHGTTRIEMSIKEEKRRKEKHNHTKTQRRNKQ